MRRHGLSLPEVLVAAVVFSGMLVCIVLTLGGYLRASRELMPGRFSSRSLAGGLQWVVREASSLSRLYAPDRAALERGFEPTLEHPLVFAREGLQGPELVAMGVNPAQQRLEQLVFETPAYDPQRLPTRRQPVGDASRMQVRLLGDGRLVVQLWPPSGVPFQTGLTLPLEAVRP